MSWKHKSLLVECTLLYTFQIDLHLNEGVKNSVTSKKYSHFGFQKIAPLNYNFPKAILLCHGEKVIGGWNSNWLKQAYSIRVILHVISKSFIINQSVIITWLGVLSFLWVPLSFLVLPHWLTQPYREGFIKIETYSIKLITDFFKFLL